ncbi:MAG: exosortase/archaeosortase family protein [Candidatus Diapherotrites archaeon]
MPQGRSNAAAPAQGGGTPAERFGPEMKSAIKFVAGIAILFFVLHTAVLFVFGLELIEFFFAQLSVFVVSLFGVHGTVQAGEPVLIFLQGAELPISISYLCTGLLELVVIVSAVLASFGIEPRKRIIGAVLAAFVTVLFNLVRISASMLLVVFFGLGIAELGHEILFRAFLFLTIAGYYALWFAWATGQSVNEIKQALLSPFQRHPH